MNEPQGDGSRRLSSTTGAGRAGTLPEAGASSRGAGASAAAMARCSASESAGAAGAGSRIVGASGGAGGWLTGSAVERWTPGGVLVEGGTGASARREA